MDGGPLSGLTQEVLDAVVGAIEDGATQAAAFESLGIRARTGASWLYRGDHGEGGLYAELAIAVRAARARAKIRGARLLSESAIAEPKAWEAARAVGEQRDPAAITTVPLDDGEQPTGLALLAKRVPAAASALDGPLDACAVAERAVQAAAALLEVQAQILAQRDEIRAEDLKPLRDAILALGKLSEQLARAEKDRALAQAARTVEMFAVSVVNILARHVTPDVMMWVRRDLGRLPQVSAAWDPAQAPAPLPAVELGAVVQVLYDDDTEAAEGPVVELRMEPGSDPPHWAVVLGRETP